MLKIIRFRNKRLKEENRTGPEHECLSIIRDVYESLGVHFPTSDDTLFSKRVNRKKSFLNETEESKADFDDSPKASTDYDKQQSLFLEQLKERQLFHLKEIRRVGWYMTTIRTAGADPIRCKINQIKDY